MSIPIRIVPGPSNLKKKKAPKSNKAKGKKKERAFYVGASADVNGIGSGQFQMVHQDAPLVQGLKLRTNAAGLRATASRDARITVRHREFLSDVPASFDFNIFGIDINPGLVQSFPWLSQIASIYETYKVRKLLFCFEPTSAATEVGSVYMGIDYNTYDAAPIDKQTLMSYQGTSRSQVWQRSQFIVPLAAMNKAYKERYIRSGPLPDQDLKTFDVGTFYLAVSGCSVSADAPVGELYIEYDIELITPTGHNVDSLPMATYYHRSSVGGADDDSGHPFSNTAPDSTGPSEDWRTGNSGTTTDGSNDIAFSKIGTYRVTYSWFGLSGGLWSTDYDADALNIVADIPVISNPVTGTCNFSYRVAVLQVPAVLSLNCSDPNLSTLAADLFIEQVPPDPTSVSLSTVTLVSALPTRRKTCFFSPHKHPAPDDVKNKIQKQIIKTSSGSTRLSRCEG